MVGFRGSRVGRVCGGESGASVKTLGVHQRPLGPSVPPPALTATAQWLTLASGLRVLQESERSFVYRRFRAPPTGSKSLQHRPHVSTVVHTRGPRGLQDGPGTLLCRGEARWARGHLSAGRVDRGCTGLQGLSGSLSLGRAQASVSCTNWSLRLASPHALGRHLSGPRRGHGGAPVPEHTGTCGPSDS